MKNNLPLSRFRAILAFLNITLSYNCLATQPPSASELWTLIQKQQNQIEQQNKQIKAQNQAIKELKDSFSNQDSPAKPNTQKCNIYPKQISTN